MPKTKPPAAPHGNRLLARLPPEEYQRLLPRLQLVPLALKHVLYEARSPIDYAYFPSRGVVSALTVMEDGRAIEVATIGDEGMVGLPLLVGAKTTANRMIVQVPGEALRMGADVLRGEASRDSAYAGCWSSTTAPFFLRFPRRWHAMAFTRFTSAVAAGC